jgi:uncharacterized metal-binding protein
MNTLYPESFRKIMQVNFECTSMSVNRIEEILNFARGMNFQRIGIAHCITFGREAQAVENYFSPFFKVFSVDCKYGRITADGILGSGGGRILCNPAGQADYLNRHHTELNISMGLCVGHDMIFSKASEGLVTNLFDKDFVTNSRPDLAVRQIQN